MSDNVSMDDQEKRWRAESDAHTLADAHAIQSNSKRHKAAQGAAKKLAEEAQSRADGMHKIAGNDRKSARKARVSSKYKGVS